MQVDSQKILPADALEGCENLRPKMGGLLSVKRYYIQVLWQTSIFGDPDLLLKRLINKFCNRSSYINVLKKR